MTTTREKRSGTLQSVAKSGRTPTKQRSIQEKEREVEEARKRLLHAEASLAAEEIPELTKKV
jgi:hypothetical protein